ncbi:tRNA 2-thiouridine-synthesizing protein [Pseudoalteromonas shioyasakiensis]|uniref:DsrH/TusB family sulfur metabolism protein n=1 Tax=Pseudoalteromonas shioyasakiensis TaxID=1190813 RepID=UPI002118115C|nr:DsrH/TusB family sulfur metabolism protein [Pseudoalteromonas shioyasakiensis]MCQ8876859.1 tRNA 2-thiouridine-synthesizing protein [Pseudoalteromonas shioyasakiensis]
MSTLHIFSKPISYYDNARIANLIQSDDKVLLVSDACFSIALYRQLAAKLLVLTEDASARNVIISQPDEGLDYTDFVALTLSTTQSITW